MLQILNPITPISNILNNTATTALPDNTLQQLQILHALPIRARHSGNIITLQQMYK